MLTSWVVCEKFGRRVAPHSLTYGDTKYRLRNLSSAKIVY